MEKHTLSKWAGLRPLVLSDEAMKDPSIISASGEIKKVKSSALSRNHVTERTQSGLVSVMGGKWTIYRLMGQEAMEAVLDHF